jgi:hypothetical protein
MARLDKKPRLKTAIRKKPNICNKAVFVANVSGTANQSFDEAVHIDRKLALDASRPKNPQALCRVRSSESDQRGRCLRYGSEVGESCPDETHINSLAERSRINALNLKTTPPRGLAAKALKQFAIRLRASFLDDHRVVFLRCALFRVQ